MKTTITFICCIFYASMLSAQDTSLWKPATKKAEKTEGLEYSYAKSSYFLNIDLLKTMLTKAPMREQKSKASDLIIDFPNFEGTIERYRVVEAPTLHSETQKLYPDLKTYVGQSIKDPKISIRFRVSNMGLKAIRFSSGSMETYLEGNSDEDETLCMIYKSNEKYVTGSKCGVKDSVFKTIESQAKSIMKSNANDGIKRTYRLAVAATGEYTQQHGGTKASALTAINDAVMFVNQIFETDFNITMTIVANNNLIHTNPTTDPYSDRVNYLDEVSSDINSQLSFSQYDIGHLFGGIDGNGLAAVGAVCIDLIKAKGYSSSQLASGGSFNRLLAHEIGHQFGSRHTWTHDGSEATGLQVEPGSGSTIMSYAGTTGPDTDVTPFRDSYFHAISIEQIMHHVKNNSCHTGINTGNAAPVVNAGSDVVIPIGTPFVLEGNATDANTNASSLTYCWEQMDDNHAATTFPDVNNTSGVAFRSFPPSSNNRRFFPAMETIKQGLTFSKWEAVPNVSRILSFRLTVRDNDSIGSANNSDDILITVTDAAGPFKVTSPNTNLIWEAGTTQTITWDVAGTNANNVNVSQVDIFLSANGGDDYILTLANNVPNNGSYTLTVPDLPGSENRIMVRANGNIFFDVSNTNFTITAPSIPSYCEASGNTQYEHISNVKLGTIDKNSGASSNGYSDFASESTDLERDEDHTINITAVNGNYQEGYAVWIDFNEDQDFVDDNELVLTIDPTSNTSVSGTINIPNWVSLGEKRMRVAMKYDAIPNSPCGSIGSGEVEDYTVNIIQDIQDTVPPEIVLNGNATVTLNLGDNFADPGATASDNIDGDITGQIVIDGDTVNTSVAGTYVITYNVKDSSGNAATEVTRTVTVENVQTGGYCEVSGNTQYEHISNVKLGTINKNSGASSNGYSDFTSESTDLERGVQHTISITATKPQSDKEGFMVWIDFNDDGDFSDPAEKIWVKQPTTDATVGGTFIVPNSVSLGEKRMRVAMKYDAIPNSPCGSVGEGEVEDYKVNITETVFRVMPSEYETLTLHPNPVKGEQLKVVSNSYNIQSYTLFTAVGQLISEKKQQNIEAIDVSGLEPGIYRIRFVVLDSLKKQKVIVKQFIKQK